MALTMKKEQLRSIFPRMKDIDEWHDIMEDLLPKYEITTYPRLAGFLAQCGHESGQFTIIQENLNYSADGLLRVFGRYFRDKDVNQYARQPEKIANLVYANRMNNGDTASGDGYRFRGRGVIQLTGRYNYTEFGKSIGMSPEDASQYMETKKGALHSACWFWDTNGLNKYADQGDMKTMTKRINGGYNGLDERMHYYHVAMRVFGGEVEVSYESTILRKGSKGPEVAKIQEALGLKADGDFGPATFEAVVKFQLRNGLTADGVVGPTTKAKLFG
jgi:putative chitinase